MSTVVNNKTHHQAFGKSFIIEKRKKGKKRAVFYHGQFETAWSFFFFFFWLSPL